MRLSRPLWGVFGLVLVVFPAIARAHVATPVASPTAELAPDLAAMTLTPADLETIGWGNTGVGNGSFRDFATDIDLLAYDPKTAPLQETHRERLAAAGFRYRAANSLVQPTIPLLPNESGGYHNDRIVTSGVVAYSSAAGAAAGFAVTEDESYDPLAKDVAGSRRFGDQSEITRGVDPASSAPWINLTFQRGNLVADVGLFDYTVAELEVATIETLADLLRQRIERILAVGSPDLSTRILRLQPIPGQIWWGYSFDRYTQLDGNDIPTYWSVLSQLESAATSPVESDEGFFEPITSKTYDFAAYVTSDPWLQAPTADQVAALSTFNSTLIDDGTEAAAAEHLASLRSGYSMIPDPSRFSLVPAAPPYGDESFAASITINGRLNFYIVARLGSVIATLFIYTPDLPTAIPAIESLMTAQLACLTSATLCAPIPMPEELMS